MGRGAGRNTPAWMTWKNHSRPHNSNPATNLIKTEDPSDDPLPPKHIRDFPLFVRSCQQQVATGQARGPMPIRVDNGLPHIRLRLGPRTTLPSASCLIPVPL
jgi:hypothetical protein